MPVSTPAKPVPTTPANLARINKFVSDIESPFIRLALRWGDEKDFEDLNDYKAEFVKRLPAGFTILKMTSSPFGFRFSIGTNAVYAVFLKRNSYGWSRLPDAVQAPAQLSPAQKAAATRRARLAAQGA
jgi:hypothetical protein